MQDAHSNSQTGGLGAQEVLEEYANCDVAGARNLLLLATTAAASKLGMSSYSSSSFVCVVLVGELRAKAPANCMPRSARHCTKSACLCTTQH